jgi:hypothetical protein
MVILRVRLEVHRQLIDALRDQRNLHLGRTGVSGVGAMRIDDLALLLSGDQGMGDLPG